jgi:hypothetical protein
LQFVNNLWQNGTGIDPTTTLQQLAQQTPGLVITTQGDIMGMTYAVCGISGTIGVLCGAGAMAVAVYMIKKKQAEAVQAQVQRQE